MSHQDDSASLRHMLDYARKVVQMLAGKQREDLESGEVLQLALTRAI